MKHLLGWVALLFGVTMSVRAEVSLFLSDCAVAQGDTVAVHLYVSDATQVTAFQTDVTLPENVRFVEARLSADASTHTLLAKGRGPGVVRIGCWSASNALLTATAEPVVTLVLAFPRTMMGGTYEVKTDGSLVVYPNGGSKKIPSTQSKAWVGVAAQREGRPLLVTEQPTAQAYVVKHVTSSRFFTLSGSTGKITIEDSCDSPEAQFFLEPAFDAGPGTYYLRTAAGYYPQFTPAGNIVRTSVTKSPSKDAAVRLVLTGERTYAMVHTKGGQALGTASNAAGSGITLRATDTPTAWQFLPSSAAWSAAALTHMAEKAATYVGLTQGEADLRLRLTIHEARRAAADAADADVLCRLAEALKTAVADAQEAQARGDSSVVTLPWGTPEPLPAVEFVVSVDREDGTTAYLVMEQGRPVLTDAIAVCTVPLQDQFYNPYTDRYALRLRGDDEEGGGTYLAYAKADGSLAEADRSAGEALRVWRVQTLTEALLALTERAGACGPNAQWRFEPEQKTLFITGTERTAYYSSAENAPWRTYRHLIQQVVLAGDFTMMGSYLLAGCTGLRKLTLTAQTPPSYTTGTFDDVPEGLEVSVFYPEAYQHFLPGCRVTSIATVQTSYVYTGQPQQLQATCDFEAAVTASNLPVTTGTYTTNATLTVTIEGQVYTFKQPVTYTIEPAPLIVTTKAYSRAYGAKNPKWRVTTEGLVGDDQESDVVAVWAVADCAADKLSPVGTYPITLTGGALKNPNYTLVLQPSTLTVTPARLTVQAADATREQGQPNPTFTYSIRGWVNGEDESLLTEWPVLTTDADESSLPGLYDIVPTGGKAPNYEIHPVTGILTITPPSSIDGVERDEEPALIYDLQGRLVGKDGDRLPKGIYIRNGKKYFIQTDHTF